MPHINARIGSDGAVIELAVAVGRPWQQRLSTLGAPAPPPMRALIDTGADLSAIHPQILHQLGVNRAGSVQIRRPGSGSGYRPVALYEVQLSIGGVSPSAPWGSLRVPSFREYGAGTAR
jgi:Aspartyl protease